MTVINNRAYEIGEIRKQQGFSDQAIPAISAKIKPNTTIPTKVHPKLLIDVQIKFILLSRKFTPKYPAQR